MRFENLRLVVFLVLWHFAAVTGQSEISSGGAREFHSLC